MTDDFEVDILDYHLDAITNITASKLKVSLCNILYSECRGTFKRPKKAARIHFSAIAAHER